MIDRAIAIHHLRGHEGWCTSHHSLHGQLSLTAITAGAPGDEPEIEDLDEVELLTAAAGEDVRRLYVTMHHARGVRVVERVARLSQM